MDSQPPLAALSNAGCLGILKTNQSSHFPCGNHIYNQDGENSKKVSYFLQLYYTTCDVNVPTDKNDEDHGGNCIPIMSQGNNYKV